MAERSSLRPDLIVLLDRFEDLSPHPDGQTIAWHAHREAERLMDRSIVDELSLYVRSERDRRRRDNAYFIIGKIGLSLSDPECAKILIDALGREDNKYVLHSLLDRIGDIPKPRDVELSAIYPFLQDVRWLVRWTAIGALKNSASEEAERRTIEHLTSTTDPSDMTYCHATLNNIGTPNSIPAISANLKSRKRDVRVSAELAVEAIRARYPPQA